MHDGVDAGYGLLDPGAQHGLRRRGVAAAGQQGAAQQLQARQHRAAQAGALKQLQTLRGLLEGAFALAEHAQQVDVVDAEQRLEQHAAAQAR